MLFGLHGTSALKILIIISINYLISRYAGGSVVSPPFLWVFNALVLFANETYSGYRFASLHSSLEFMVRFSPLECTVELIYTVGQHPRYLSPMASQFQYYHAQTGLFRNGLSLGNHSTSSERGKLDLLEPAARFDKGLGGPTSHVS